jgi:glycosyltransferase involved in cell wall biosynthesis
LWRKKNIPTEKLFYTPNAAHPEKWKPLEPKRRDSMRASFGLTGARVIGFSGNLRSWHGVNLLIEAVLPIMARDPDIKLLFIGAVDDPEYLERQNVPDEIRKKRFVFTGPLAYGRMGDHIDLADCMVIPYPDSDLFYFSPMKLFEAMCLGKLIVAPRLGQIEEMLGNLASPLLYDPKDPQALGRCLESALTRISSLPQASILGADARERIEAGHTWAHRGRMVVKACEFAINARQVSVAP